MKRLGAGQALQTTLLFYLQSRLKEAVQLLEDYKHGTLPPGVTNKEVRGKKKAFVKSLPLPKAGRMRWGFSGMCRCRAFLVGLLVESRSDSGHLIADFLSVASGPLQLNGQCVTVNWVVLVFPRVKCH